ncbi:hypothetical protein U27_05812 [Candidatus Vecturithrix granuli]|uniref:Porin n=1 Tax=Vecturithrix granuli TaxID=1499967 RepID=A0A081C2N2_VECG1|nr:hypothetical protein U27_05812 [Candidatus Vecturithrix granuli]
MKNRGCFLMFWMLCLWAIWDEEAQAQFMNNVSIHGFGGWAYGKTDNENQYLVGNEDGSYDHVSFSLSITANPYEQLSIYVQPGYSEGGVEFEEEDVSLDYAFAEWYFSDRFILRVGKVKAPFMLFTEVYNVGTLRPFYSLSQGVYQEIATEAYKGVGLTGLLYSNREWELQYDVYGGKLSLLPNPFLDAREYRFKLIETTATDVIGGRITVHTPLNGLSLGVSSYTGEFDFEISDTVQKFLSFDDRYVLFGISAEYLSDRWWIRSEYLAQKKSPKIEIDVAYLEVAYLLTEHWQIAGRYEVAEFGISAPEFQGSPTSTEEHQDLVLGLNYWMNPNLVFKFSYHIVEGNRFAIPNDVADYLAAYQKGSFDETTHLIVFGTQFSF